MWEIARALQPMKVDLFEEDMDIGNPRNIAAFSEAFRLHCEGILEDKQFLEFLKSREYTVGMAEYYDGCAFGLFEMLNIRSTHQLSAIPICEQTAFIHGLPAPPSFVPGKWISGENYCLIFLALISNQAQITSISGFFERVRNLYFHLRYSYSIAPRLMAPTNEVFKEKISADFPPLLQLMQKVDYVWVNTNEQLDFARPTTPKFKFIGGIALKPPTPLDEELLRLIDESPKGVVLMSFGSLLDDLATKPAVLRTILDSFAQFPDHLFLCKLTIGDDAQVKELLQTHPNLRIYSGIAVALDRKTLTVYSLTSAIKRVLEDETIRSNLKDLREKLVSQPFKAAEVFVKTVEYAAQFNGMPELTLRSTSLSTFEYFCLDVFFSFIAVIISMVALIAYVVRRCLYGKQKRKIE
ncbi:Glucuronosyltransferase [Aphelenchoides fujianensis]|nr:Glucuronosyltransferase [Aphelenchoides fujianensis]